MPKDKLTDYSATNASNTDVGGVNIDEGMLPSAVNNAIREQMTHLKDFADGTTGIDVLNLQDDDASASIKFQAPAAVTTTTTFTLPDGDGDSGQTLITNGSGTLAWAAPYGNRNLIINGSFQVWQRGTSTTSDGYQTADRYQGSSQNGAATMSQQSFTIGQTDVPGEPKYYYRHNQTTQATDYPPNIQHRIEGVRSLAGQKVTLSVYAKASKSLALKTYIFQHFGSGGSPSAGVVVENSPTIATLTTSWQRVTYTFDMDSISGKTLGTNGDDYLAVYLQFPTSDTYSVDLALLQIEVGEQATPFEHEPYGVTLQKAQRYYISVKNQTTFAPVGVGRAWSGTNGNVAYYFPCEMRSNPTVSVASLSKFDIVPAGGNPTAVQNDGGNLQSVKVGFVQSAGITNGAFYQFEFGNNTDGDLRFDAEL